MATIHIKNLSKSYGNAPVFSEFSLDVRDGEFVALIGPSGCGKSTMLKVMAGLELPDNGSIWIGDRDVTYLAPGNRDIAMVFQSYALYPHLTVRRNIEFGLRMQGVAKNERKTEVEGMAHTLGITSLLERRPSELSGGQRQRVALGRALVRKPHAFLMDEPLSNLDAKLRVQMRAEITTLQRRVGVTTIYVTHDQTEAMTMADRIVVLHGGKVQQIATPQNMFDNPENMFVAGFIGSPAMNFFLSKVRRSRGGVTVSILGKELSYRVGKDTDVSDDEVIVGIRPEHFIEPVKHFPVVEITPTLVERLGSENLVHFPDKQQHLDGNKQPTAQHKLAKIPNKIAVTEKEPLQLSVSADKILLFNAQTQQRLHTDWKN